MSDTEPHRDWQRGLLPTCALAVLAEEPAHGYAVAQRLQAAGLGPVKGGTLYPVLNRLEEDGALTSHWREGDGGPGRKVFTLTDEGRARLVGLRERWVPFAGAVAGLLAAPASMPASAAPTTSTTPTTSTAPTASTAAADHHEGDA